MDSQNDEHVCGAAQIDRARWFDEHYDVLATDRLRPSGRRIHLGTRAPRSCRFCQKNSSETTFKEIAHAFPEQIGNKTLIDHSECDACNKHFAAMLDDDFAKWTMPWRTIGRVRGKRGIPTYKAADESIRIEVRSPRQMSIIIPKSDVKYTLDKANRMLTFPMERQPYVPMAAFKCMVKMGLSVMPPTEAPRCSHLAGWLLEPTHMFQSFLYRPLAVIRQSIPGPLPSDLILYYLLRRKVGVEGVPYLVFVLHFANTMFQVVLPMRVEDRVILQKGAFKIRLFPHLWGGVEHQKAYGESGYKAEDLSACDVVRGEVVEMKLKYKWDE